MLGHSSADQIITATTGRALQIKYILKAWLFLTFWVTYLEFRILKIRPLRAKLALVLGFKFPSLIEYSK